MMHISKACSAGESEWGLPFFGLICEDCDRGNYCPGDNEEYSCPGGTVAPNTKMSSCNVCPAGTYSSSNRQSCNNCGVGTTSNSRSTTCYGCPVGTYSNSPGTAPCNDCPAGQFASSTGTVNCDSCPPNTYSEFPGSSSCTTCDTGYTSDGGASYCYPINGDGMRKIGEECDDGNLDDGDGCSSTCTLETGFTCVGGEDGVTTDQCDPICGDGMLYSYEECDDENVSNGDGCDENCQVEDFYHCENGTTTNPSTCIDLCGDGVVMVDTVTNCDDNNTVSGDGCSSTCEIEPGYECYGGTTFLPDVCNTRCGDGVKTFDEECDDGGIASQDGCDFECKLESGFNCIHNNPFPNTFCSDTCGDGKVFLDTECDDGNLYDGDGCSQICEIEPGYICENGTETTASQCYEICGDGLDFGNLECDDGDADEDGCDSTCNFEKCYECVNGTQSSPDVCRYLPINTTISDVTSSSSFYVMFDYDMNITDITIYDMTVEMHSDYPITFTWSASYETSRKLKVNIHSNIIFKGTETVSVSMHNWKTFRGPYGGCVQPQSLSTTMPNSLESSVKAAEEGSFIASIAMYSGILINVVLVTVLGGSLETVWCLLNCLQIISYLPILTSYFPEHVQVMFSFLGFANMDIEIFSDLFVMVIGVDSLDLEPYNDRFADNEIESTLFLDNCASLLFSLILAVLSFVLCMISYLVFRCEAAQSKIKGMLSSYYFNGPIRIFVEGFLETCFGALLNAVSLSNQTTTIEKVSFYISIVIFGGCVALMSIVSAILYDKRKQIFDENSIYSKRIGTIYEELREDKNGFAAQFYPIFMFRRLIFVTGLILLVNQTQIQLNMFILCTCLILAYQTNVKPFKNKVVNMLNNLNELNLLAIAFICIIFETDQKNVTMVDITGWVMIGIICVVVGINFAVVFIEVIAKKIINRKRTSTVNPNIDPIVISCSNSINPLRNRSNVSMTRRHNGYQEESKNHDKILVRF